MTVRPHHSMNATLETASVPLWQKLGFSSEGHYKSYTMSVTEEAVRQRYHDTFDEGVDLILSM